MKERIVRGIEKIFGYGIMIALLVGGITFIGYLTALILGGNIAAVICAVIYEKVYPVLIWISTSMIVLGLIKMYIAHDSAFKTK